MGSYLDRIRDFYDTAPTESTRFGRFYRSLLGRYYRHLIPPQANILEIGCGSGELLAQLPNRDVTGVDLSAKQISAAERRVPHGVFITSAAETLCRHGALDRTFDYIVLSDTVNFSPDVQTLLERLKDFANSDTRLVLNFYNTLWFPVLQLATFFGLKSRQPMANWLSASDVRGLLDLSNWEVIHQNERIVCPVFLFGLERLLNRFIAPLVPFLSLTIFQTARPRPTSVMPPQSVSIVVPARNEAGNIDSALERIPAMGTKTEIIFVEGHSKDETWHRIQDAIARYPHLDVKAFHQTGKGKGNAVREGFAAATGDILMILDADLTMPPEELPKFYAALVSGHTEFANGVRLIYPMDEKAMRFLNMCANKFFSIAFAENRAVFGDFDPFGDFDLLFGARKLNLKISDIPIRYRERTYGTTQINRWSHGLLLFRMLAFGLVRLKML
jgi:SAM-dependent methyltransferase